jgi:hypothetical protein
VAAVTTILVTPSFTDDVPGLMHRSHTSLVLVLALVLAQMVYLVTGSRIRPNQSGRVYLSSNFLELMCQHLC